MDTLCIPTVMYNSLKQVQKLQSDNPVTISNTRDRSIGISTCSEKKLQDQTGKAVQQ